MGIPSYFSFIVKNHRSIIRRINKQKICVERLYLDCNSILYDAVHSIDFSGWTETNSMPKTTIIIQWSIRKIEEYIANIGPSGLVYIAFDGVAPVAKMKQQRERRYKSWYQSTVYRDIFGEKMVDPWNTSAITPGTQFMAELNNKMRTHFTTTTTEAPAIIFSGSDEAGEGEHKIFQHIRNNSSQQMTVVYGLDADLIMLSITHLPVCANIYLFRETPHFIQNIDPDLEPNQTYMLDIPALAKIITLDMNNGIQMTTPVHYNRIYDYILICFMLGNDFLPHFPSINIRTGGINKLITAYKATIGRGQTNLTDGTQIFWHPFRIFINYLAKLEEHHFKEETKLRDKRGKNVMRDDTPDAKYKKFEVVPSYERETEWYINPFQPHWQSRYYKSLFINNNNMELLQHQVCNNYLEGLEWCIRYYTNGCPNWRWKYTSNYPPLLEDLCKHIPATNIQPFMQPNSPNGPVHPLVQLCYVLPKTSLGLLPTELFWRMSSTYPSFYRNDCDFMWAYCKYFWESHIELSEIEMSILENEIQQFLV